MNTQSPRARYMLRRNLAIWKPQETISETIAFCKKTGIDEIIWKIDPEDFNHGFTPLPMIREFLPWLERAREQSAEKRIGFSINPWVALNHADRYRYPDGPPPGFHWRVTPAGQEVRERACPLSRSWREWFLEAYRLYATAEPDKLWIEDEFRTFDKITEIGCYCQSHLETFAREIGRPISREELVDRITRPGNPDPLRGQWLEFQGKIMVDVCRELEKIVHAESPRTRLGLMQSWSTDGRWWSDAILALAGPHRPLARTSLAPYQEFRATAFLPDNADILKETACLPPETENCPELENFKYTAYSKSARTTRLQIVLSQVLGNPGITMNLFDMLGTPIGQEPRIERMLCELKPVLDAIAAVGPAGMPRGVAIPFDKRYADFVHARPGFGFDLFKFDGGGWATPLQGSGIPVVFNGDGPVQAVTGQSPRSLAQEQIKQLLSTGLLLDGSAAMILTEMGFSRQLGVGIKERVDCRNILLSAERDDWGDPLSAKDRAYMTTLSVAEPDLGYLYSLDPQPGAKIVSSFVDSDHHVALPGLTLFENEWGGRVAVHPYDLSEGITGHFMNWHRRNQLQRTIRWLGRERVDLFADGGAWMMPVRRDFSDFIVIAVLNFETDPWEEIRLTLTGREHSEKRRFEILDHVGNFRAIEPGSYSVDGENIRVCFFTNVPALDFVVLKGF